MRATLIVLGDTTDHGGEVISAAPAATADGRPVARVGDLVSCPRCGGDFVIVQGNPAMHFDGAAAAYDGCAVACGARLIASQSGMTTLLGNDDLTPRRFFSFDDVFGGPAPVAPVVARDAGTVLAIHGVLYFRADESASMRKAIGLCFDDYTAIASARTARNARAWRFEPAPGALALSMPGDVVAAQPAVFQRLFVDCARRLHAVHGYASGVDGTETVGWLAATNYDMVAAVGGMAALRSALPRDWFAKYDYGAGIIVQAGPAPAPVPSVLLNQALRLADVAGDTLLQYRTRLLDEPRLTAASTLVDVL